MAGEVEAAGPRACAGCGQVFPRARLSCPACQRLVHGEQLRALQAEARQHAAAGERSAELSAWRHALELVPDGSRQAQQIQQKLAELTAAGVSPAAEQPSKSALGKLAGLGALGLLLWKFKAVIAFVLTKGKLVLLGLTKTSTLLSMLLSAGVYWSIWGWQFAVGLVLSIYLHEMGHVLALRRLGIAATAPMFVPGLGAFIRAKQYPATPAEDAEVGLAGPIWGLGAALLCWAVGVAFDAPLFMALARFGAWINLFNLLPVWQLDGGRGLRALDRRQRWIAAALVGGVLLLTGEMMLLLILLAIAARALFERAPAQGHMRTLVTYTGLTLALGWLTTLHVPGATP